MAFLGNVFTPMSGLLLDIGRLTPLYGYAALARFPLTEGWLPVGGRDPLWLPVANVLAWTVDLLPAGAVGRTPEPGADVNDTPRTTAHVDALPINPWVKWGWAFAAIWLVFLVYPIIAVVDADVPVAVQVLGLSCIVGFAVANVLGHSIAPDRVDRAGPDGRPGRGHDPADRHRGGLVHAVPGDAVRAPPALAGVEVDGGVLGGPAAASHSSASRGSLPTSSSCSGRSCSAA